MTALLPSRNKKSRLLRSTALAAGLGLAIGFGVAQQSANAVSLPAPNCGFGVLNNCLEFDDFTVYSLALLNLQSGNGEPLPGDPYYVDTTGNKLHSDIVIISNSAGATTNNQDQLSNVDDAYQALGPSDGANFLMGATDPANGPTGDNLRGPGSVVLNGSTAPGVATGDLKLWDVNPANLSTWLGSDKLVFYFNVNDDNSTNGLDGQDLLAWQRVTLTDFGGDGVPDDPNDMNPDDVTKTYTLSGNPGTPGIMNQAQTLNDDDILPGSIAGHVSSDSSWAYVHGKICVDATVSFGACAGSGTTVNQNLGANSAAFALYSAELDADVKSGMYELMSVDTRLSHLENGKEIEFIRKTTIEAPPMMEDPVQIHGTKYNDLNGNGLFDAGEPGLEGWTIFLCDDQSDCTGNPFRTAMTDENGDYWFMDEMLTAGQYRLYEVLEPNWTQTGTSAGAGTSFIDLTLAAGTVSLDKDFFNCDEEVSCSPPPTPMPEPGTLAMFGLGLLGLGLARRQRKRRNHCPAVNRG